MGGKTRPRQMAGPEALQEDPLGPSPPRRRGPSEASSRSAHHDRPEGARDLSHGFNCGRAIVRGTRAMQAQDEEAMSRAIQELELME
jgi:hypothetical protein